MEASGLSKTSRTGNAHEIRMDDLMLPYTFDISLFGDIEDPGFIDHILETGVSFHERRAGNINEKQRAG